MNFEQDLKDARQMFMDETEDFYQMYLAIIDDPRCTNVMEDIATEVFDKLSAGFLEDLHAEEAKIKNKRAQYAELTELMLLSPKVEDVLADLLSDIHRYASLLSESEFEDVLLRELIPQINSVYPKVQRIIELAELLGLENDEV